MQVAGSATRGFVHSNPYQLFACGAGAGLNTGNVNGK